MTQVGLLGANGRMGKWVSKLIQTEFAAQAQLTAHPLRGEPLNTLLQCQVVIDFALPVAMEALAQLALQQPKDAVLPVFVVGSTGWKDLNSLQLLAKRTPVLVSTNFSTGVQALLHILNQNSALLKSLGYSPVLIERHHIHKKDAPSGTAKSIQVAIDPTAPDSVQTHAIRSGEVIGDHEITFHGTADKIVLGHFAQDRSIFARGAIEVGLWLAKNRNRFQNETTPLDMSDYFKSRFLSVP